jgi:hypothetical protein
VRAELGGVYDIFEKLGRDRDIGSLMLLSNTIALVDWKAVDRSSPRARVFSVRKYILLSIPTVPSPLSNAII